MPSVRQPVISARCPQGAAAYYRHLPLHTNRAQQQWDAAAGYYSASDFNFAAVLGNAVPLTHGTYDAAVAAGDTGADCINTLTFPRRSLRPRP